MSSSIPRQPAAHDAARADAGSAPAIDSQLPEFQPHTPSPYSPIEREIERSERASAALAATRALARASFTDSQLAADDAQDHDAGCNDFDASGWARTEHVAFDPTPQADSAHDRAPRNLVGGSFDPGIASQQGRQFPGASISQAVPMRTRSGAMARFAQESRHAPRAEHAPVAAPHGGPMPSTAHYEKPVVMPMLAPPPARAPIAPRARASARPGIGEPAKFLLAGALGMVVVLAGGGVAWKAGWLSRQPDEMAQVTHAVAAQAEAARLLSQERNIPVVPAAGPSSRRSDAEVDAALAAAARAAAVPADSVRAAGPARLVPASAPAMASTTAAAAARASGVRPVVPHAKDSIDEAIANAQARADRFLAPETGSSAPTAPAPTNATPTQ
jgi:hypothetical protein